MAFFGFDRAQWHEIFVGIKKGLDPRDYAWRECPADVMKIMRECLEKGVDLSEFQFEKSLENVKLAKKAIDLKIDISIFFQRFYPYCLVDDFASALKSVIKAVENKEVDFSELREKKYDAQQIVQICDAYNDGIKILEYITQDAPWQLIKFIKDSLKAGKDMSAYKHVTDYDNFIDYNCEYWIGQLNKWLHSEFNVNKYVKEGYNLDQIEEIYFGWLANIDTSKYQNATLDWEQMKEIRLGEEVGINTSIYANERFSAEQMKQIREGLEAGIDVTRYANPDIDKDRMEDMKKRMIKMKKVRKGNT